MAHYDVLVISHGPAGLAAAAKSAKLGKKTLLLGNGNGPSGLWATYKMGAFELELRETLVSGKELQDIRPLFEELNIWQPENWKPYTLTKRMLCRENGLDIELPVQLQSYKESLTAVCEECREPVERLCELVLAADTVQKLAKEGKKPGTLGFLFGHKDYLRCVGLSLEEVLQALSMPEAAAQIITNEAVEYGGSANVQFETFAADFLRRRSEEWFYYMGGSERLMLRLDDALRQAGGEAWYRCSVAGLLQKDGRVCGVRLTDGYEIAADQIIVDLSCESAAARWLHSNAVESKIGCCTGFSVLLGVSKGMGTLGLQQNHIQLDSFVDAGKERESWGDRNAFGSCTAIVAPVAGQGKKKTMLSLHARFTPSAFEDMTVEKYPQMKRIMAEKLVKSFEKAAHVQLRGSIEQAVIVGPVEYAAMGGDPYGCCSVLEGTAAAGGEAVMKNGLICCPVGSRGFSIARALCCGFEAAKLASGEKEAKQ